MSSWFGEEKVAKSKTMILKEVLLTKKQKDIVNFCSVRLQVLVFKVASSGLRLQVRDLI